MNAPLIALTGATGFIGRHLLRDLPQRGYRVRVLLRRPAEVPPGASSAVIGDIASPRNMSQALRDVDAIIHSAALAHAMSGHPEDDYRTINTQATVDLGRAAVRAGIRRFVFLSSIRAQSGASASEVLTEEGEPAPTEAYGRSKLEAERGLAELDLDWVALRPVLVYGPGVKGNMAALIELARSRFPLPLGALSAKRSLLAVENLAAAVDAVLRSELALRRPFIVADEEPVSVAEMVAALRSGFDRRPGLIPVPKIMLAAAARLAGREEAFKRLSETLVASPDALTRLGWRPLLSTQEGLRRLAQSSVSAP